MFRLSLGRSCQRFRAQQFFQRIKPLLGGIDLLLDLGILSGHLLRLLEFSRQFPELLRDDLLTLHHGFSGFLLLVQFRDKFIANRRKRSGTR